MKGYFFTREYYITFTQAQFGIARYRATLHKSANDKVVKSFKATNMKNLIDDVLFYCNYKDIELYK